MPDCPVCNAEQPPRYRLDLDKPVNIAFGSVTDRAVKITHKVAEEVYGLTDLRGSAGGDAKTHDIGEPGHPKLTPIQEKMAEGWRKAQAGGMTLPGTTALGSGSLMEMARSATAAAKMSGSPDPIRTATKAIRDHAADEWGPKNAIRFRQRRK